MEQLEYIASSVEIGHRYYGMAFYSPPASDRLEMIECEWQAKLKRLEDEFDAYRKNAQTAVKRALRQHDDEIVSIHENGEVLRYGGTNRENPVMFFLFPLIFFRKQYYERRFWRMDEVLIQDDSIFSSGE